MSTYHVQITQPPPAYRLNVIGVSGEGKSTYRERFLRHIRRATLANPMGDFHIGEIVTTDEYRELINEFRRGVLRVTVIPTSYDPTTMLEEFDALCAYVEEVGAQHFAIEEISLYRGESGLSLPGNLNRIAIKGRHRGVSLSAYGQRFHQFPLIVRGQATEIIAFRQSDPMDVRDFDKRISPDVPPVAINQLPEHHFLQWTPAEGVVLRAPLDEFSDSIESPILARGLRRADLSSAFDAEEESGQSSP